MRCRWEQRVGPKTRVQRVLPDNCADVLVFADGRAVLVGPATGVEVPALPAGTLVRGLRFEPHALGAVFGLDAAELTDQTVALDAVLRPALARAVAEAAWGADLLGGVAGLGGAAGWLARRWQDVRPDRATVGIVQALTTPEPALGTGAVRVETVAERLGFSPRHLRRLIRAETGLTPKTLHRVARLHDFLRRAEAGRLPVGLAAAAAGYADQPHASREVRALTGLSPRQLLAERGAHR